MAIQFNLEQGGMMYAPARDIRYGWAAALRLVARRFDTRAWPEIADWLDERGVAWEDQCLAMGALCRTMVESCQNPEESLEEILRRCGWFQGPFECRVAVMAMLGTVCLGQMFYAVRSTGELGHRPAEFEPLLHVEGDAMRLSLWRPVPWWRRWWNFIRRLVYGRPRSPRTRSQASSDWPTLQA